MEQNPSGTEIHKLKITVAVSHVHLLVRFPCRLSFQLKADQSQVETANTYELKKGQCEINQSISLQVNFKYNTQNQTYEDKKIKLTVMMSSANGIIPAGLINFNPCNKNSQQKAEYTFSLQKCPDRAAQITFSQWYQFIGVSNANIYQSNMLDARYSNNSFNKPQLKMSTLTNSNPSQNYNKNLKYSPAKERDVSPNNLGNTTPRSRVRTYTSPVFQQNIQSSSYQPNFGGNEYRMSQSYTQQQRQVQGYQNYRNNTINQSHYGNNIGSLNQQSPSMMNLNDSKLQYSQKAYYLKQIAKLKGQVKTLQNQDKWEQLIRVKDQNQGLSLQIQKQKQKYRNLQKKDREYNISIKQLKDQIQRLKVKLTQSEALKNQYDLLSLEKEKKIKQYIIQIKNFEEKIADLSLSVASYQKKIQFKEISFQEQLKKMTQKYNQSQSQRQKTTYEYNLLLSKMQQTQKKNQLLAKDRQRLFNDQKNKLNKKIQGLNQQHDKIKQELSDRQTQLADLSHSFKALQKKESQIQASCLQLQNELDYSNSALKKQEEQRKISQKEIQILRVAEQERNTVKKKLNQSVGELSRTNQKLQKLTNQFNLITSKVKQQEETIKEKNKEKASLNSKINILSKEIEDLRKDQQKITRQSQSLSAQNMNSNQRINDLRTKLETQQRQADEIIMKYEQQLSYLSKSKQYAENQSEDLKWSLQKQKQQYEDLCYKFKQANQEILNINKQLLQAHDKIKRLQTDLSEGSSSIKSLTGQKIRLQAKQRQLLELVKAKTNQNYEQNKKKLQTQQEIYLLRERLSQSTVSFTDKQNNDQKTFREKQKEIHNLHEELTKVKMDLLTKQQDLNSQIQTTNVKTNQINHLKDTNQNLTNQINQLQIRNEQIKQQLKNAQFQLKNTKIQLQNTRTGLNSTAKELQKLKKDWDQYRNNTAKALQQLIIQISKDQDSVNNKQNLLAFPDMNVSSMQVQAVKKRNLVISKYRQKIVQITQELVLFKNNYKKVKQNLQQKQAELDFCVNKEKEKFKQYHSEASQQKNVLTQQIRALEEKVIQQSGEIQKLLNQHKKSKEIIQEFSCETKQLLAEKQSLRLEVKNLQEKVLQLKSHEIKAKATHQNRFSQINQQSQSQIFKVKQTIAEHEKRQITFEKSIMEKDEAIKKLQNQCNTIIYQRDRNQQKCIQITQKLNLTNDAKKQVQKKVKLLQSQLKDQIAMTNQANEQVSNERTKLQQVKSKYNEVFQLLSDAQLEIQRGKQQIQIGNLTIENMDNAIKQKQDKHKTLIEKTSLQLKEFKQKIITQNSDLELKGYMISQNESMIANLKENIEQLKSDASKKKQEIVCLNQTIQTLKNTILYNEQAQHNLQNQKDNLEDENERLKHKVSNIENDLEQNRMIQEILQLKNAQNSKLKQELQLSRRQYQKNIVQFRNQDKNKLAASRYNMKNQEELKRKIKELQQMLELKHFDLAIERKKWINEGEREKQQLISENYELGQRIQDLQNQFDFQRAQLNKEIESLGLQCGELTKILQDKEQILYAIENVVQQIESGNVSKAKQGKQHVQRLKRRMQQKIRQQSISKSMDNADENNFLVSVRQTILQPDSFKLQEEGNSSRYIDQIK